MMPLTPSPLPGLTPLAIGKPRGYGQSGAMVGATGSARRPGDGPGSGRGPAAAVNASPAAASRGAEKTCQRAKAELPGPLYPYYRLLDRIMSANGAINQKATIGLRSLDESSCKKMLGDAGVCAVAAE